MTFCFLNQQITSGAFGVCSLLFFYHLGSQNIV